MRRACVILICLLPLAARAQDEEPPSGEPPTVPMVPPTVIEPPPWVPYYVVPGPSPAQIDALEQAGRRRKRAGAILLGTGGAIAIVGTGLLIGGAWDDQGSCDWHTDHHHQHHHCGDSALSIAGATTTLVGLGAMIPGIVSYVSGGSDVARARRMRGYYWGSVSLAPTLHPDGAGVKLTLSR